MGGITKAWDKAYNEIQDAVEEAVKKEMKDVFVRYSAYDWDDDDIPINNLNEIPIKGKVTFVSEDEDANFQHTTTSPTWLDIAVIANRMILVTDDKHHCFLESLEVEKGNDGLIATIIMGS